MTDARSASAGCRHDQPTEVLLVLSQSSRESRRSASAGRLHLKHETANGACKRERRAVVLADRKAPIPANDEPPTGRVGDRRRLNGDGCARDLVAVETDARVAVDG